MRILFLDPFHGGSHAAVAEGYARHSRHDIGLLTLPIDGGWRWRMRGAAVTLARRLRGQVERSNVQTLKLQLPQRPQIATAATEHRDTQLVDIALQALGHGLGAVLGNGWA